MHVMHNNSYKNDFLVSHFLGNNVEKQKKNTKNGRLFYKSNWNLKYVFSSCERALGINKVTKLERWCPKLEVRIIMSENIFIDRWNFLGLEWMVCSNQQWQTSQRKKCMSRWNIIIKTNLLTCFINSLNQIWINAFAFFHRIE